MCLARPGPRARMRGSISPLPPGSRLQIWFEGGGIRAGRIVATPSGGCRRPPLRGAGLRWRRDPETRQLGAHIPARLHVCLGRRLYASLRALGGLGPHPGSPRRTCCSARRDQPLAELLRPRHAEGHNGVACSKAPQYSLSGPLHALFLSLFWLRACPPTGWSPPFHSGQQVLSGQPCCGLARPGTRSGLLGTAVTSVTSVL